MSKPTSSMLPVPAGDRIRVTAVVDKLRMGGAETLVSEFALVANDVGVEFSVATLVPSADVRAAQIVRELGIEPAVADIGSRLTPASPLRVYRVLAAQRPDIVHTHLGRSDLLGALAARALRVPVVSTIHATSWKPETEHVWREHLLLYLSAWARRRCAARVIAVSAAARDAYLARGFDRSEHVVVIHNGVASDAAPGHGPAVRRELGLAPDEIVLGMLSGLQPGKGHDVAIRALATLRQRFPRLRLLVVGDGEMRDQIESWAAPLGDAVVLTGWRADVMRLLDAMDVLVHPSSRDAFPTSLLEAMAASVPVVATEVGGIKEIVNDGETGRLLKAAEDLAVGLQPLLEDSSLRRELGQAGRRRFEREFTGAVWAQRTRHLYDEVLDGRTSLGRRLSAVT